jgi:hypothetical protein
MFHDNCVVGRKLRHRVAFWQASLQAWSNLSINDGGILWRLVGFVTHLRASAWAAQMLAKFDDLLSGENSAANHFLATLS